MSQTPPRQRSAFRLLSISPAEKVREDLSQFVEDNIVETPPFIQSILNKYPHLAKLGNLIHEVLYSAEKMPISFDVALDLDKGFRYLVSNFGKFVTDTTHAAVSLQNVKSTASLIDKIEKNSSTTEYMNDEITRLNSTNKRMKDDLFQKTKEIDRLQTKNSELNRNLKRLEAKHLDELNAIKEDNQMLENQTNLLQQQIDFFKRHTEQYRLQIKDLEDKAELSRKEIIRLEAANEKKREQIIDLSNDIEKIKMSPENDEKIKEFIEKQKEQFQKQEKKYKQTISKLLDGFNDQQHQIKELISIKKKSKKMLIIQNKVLDLFSTAIAKQKQHNKKLKDEISKQKTEILELNEKIQLSANEKSKLSETISFQEKIFTQICNLHNIQATYDTIIPLIKENLSKRITQQQLKDEKDKQEKLISIINGMTRLFRELLSQKRSDFPLLACCKTNEIEKSVSTSLLKDIEALNKQAHLYGDINEEDPAFKVLFTKKISDLPKEIEDKSLALVFAKLSISFLNHFKKQNKQIIEVVRLLNKNYVRKSENSSLLSPLSKQQKEPASTPSSPATKLESKNPMALSIDNFNQSTSDPIIALQNEIEDILSLVARINREFKKLFNIKTPPKSNDCFDLLLSYCNEAIKLGLQTEKHFRSYNSTVKVSSLPAFVSNSISDLKYELQSAEARAQIVAENTEKEIKKTQSETANKLQTMENEKEKLQNELNNYKKQIAELEINEDNLKQSLKSAETKIQDLATRNLTITERLDVLETESLNNKYENERLNQLLRNKNASFEIRLNDVLEQERANLELQFNLEKTMLNDKIKKLEEALTEKRIKEETL